MVPCSEFHFGPLSIGGELGLMGIDRIIQMEQVPTWKEVAQAGNYCE